MTVPGRQPTKPVPGRHIAALAGVCGLGGILLWSGCTVTKENYRTLSMFFDGVPDPNAVVTTVDPMTGELVAGANLSIHKPYQEERCDECHRPGLRLSRMDATVCMSCHDKVPGEHAWMHGPVVAGACMWCHHPHESAQPHLLRNTPQKVCAQCHTPQLLLSEKVPEHADQERSCLDCHVGHGGSRRFMLREGGPIAPSPTGAAGGK